MKADDTTETIGERLAGPLPVVHRMADQADRPRECPDRLVAVHRPVQDESFVARHTPQDVEQGTNGVAVRIGPPSGRVMERSKECVPLPQMGVGEGWVEEWLRLHWVRGDMGEDAGRDACDVVKLHPLEHNAGM